MKRLLPIIALLLLSACGREGTPYGERISFSSSVLQFRSGFDDAFSPVWNDGDLVGIFAEKNGGSFGNNVFYCAEPDASNPSKARFGAVDAALNWEGEGSYRFYAYSPATMADCSPHALPFSIPAVQDGTLAGLADYNLIAASASAKPSEDVAFAFRHLFCLVQLDLRGSAALQGRMVSAATLSSDTLPLAGVSGLIDLTADPAEILPDGAASSTINISKPLSPGKLFFVCLPSPGRKGKLRAGICLDDGSSFNYEFTDVELKPNTRLQLNATLDPSGPVAGMVFPACLSFASRQNDMAAGSVSGNTVRFTNGAVLERTDAPLYYNGNSDNPYVSSRNWAGESAYQISLPLAEPFSGEFRLDFILMSRGLASWRADWSSDGVMWHGAAMFDLVNSSTASVCSANFTVPGWEQIPAGGRLLLRIMPSDLSPCSSGARPWFDDGSDPRLLGSIVITPGSVNVTDTPSGALQFYPFDDCVQGVDAVALSAENLLACVAIDGPAYDGAVNAWSRHGYLRMGSRGAQSQLLLPALEALGTGKGVKVELDLAAYYSSARAYDVGSIEVGVHHADTDNVQVIRTPELKDGKWHHCSFTFADADSASQVLVRSNSTRFYVDNICVKAL